MAILLCAGVFTMACNGNDKANLHIAKTDELAAYKEDAITTLTAYVADLNTDGYSDENLAAIKEFANTGKENINAATAVNEPAAAG